MRHRKILAFLLFLGALVIPIPERTFHHFFDHFFHPLQLIATKLAMALLGLARVPVSLNGNMIGVDSLVLYVPECCSGIRSLLTLVMLVIAYACLRETRIWVRVLLTCLTVPVAVATDSSRILGTGLLVNYSDLDIAERFFHFYSGWLIFLLELITLLILHRVILFVWPDRALKNG